MQIVSSLERSISLLTLPWHSGQDRAQQVKLGTLAFHTRVLVLMLAGCSTSDALGKAMEDDLRSGRPNQALAIGSIWGVNKFLMLGVQSIAEEKEKWVGRRLGPAPPLSLPAIPPLGLKGRRVK